MRTALRWFWAVAMIAIGAGHFIAPEPFVKIVPPWLPAPLALVHISGVFEILGGVGLLVPRTRRAAGWGLVALYLAVYPANINMLVNDVTLGIPRWGLWARLPLQLVFIWLALWVSRPVSALPADGDAAAKLSSEPAQLREPR